MPNAGAATQIAFAVPEDGLVTLGVFDKTGHLVRTLHMLEPEENFPKGLNGLITTWDGCDGSGNHLPPGHYHIRGYLVPEITVEGVAYHFNDWLSETNAPPITWINDIAALPGGDVLIVGQTTHGTLVCARHNADEGFLWSTGLDHQPPVQMAPVDRSVLLKSATSWKLLSLADGSPSDESLPATDPASVASLTPLGNSALLATGDHLELFPPDTTPFPSPPVTFTSLAALKAGIAGASETSCFLAPQDAPFEKIPLPVTITSLSPAGDESFWFTGTTMDTDKTPLVGEADTNGEILRLLSIPPDSPPPILVRSLPHRTGILLLAESGATQSLRFIRKTEDGSWATEWERVIQKAPAFGFQNGTVVGDASATPQHKSLRIRLTENPLTGEHAQIAVIATQGAEGTFLSSEDGLPLVQISDRTDTNRITIDRGTQSDSIRVLQGSGNGAEEFLVEDLGKVIPLNVGGIDL